MSNIKALVDQLGAVKAQLADISKIEKALKDELISLGVGSYDGETFSASVSETVRESIPVADAVEKLEELGVSKQWFVAHTKKSPVTTVKVVARKAA
jgi:hypothetical protein